MFISALWRIVGVCWRKKKAKINQRATQTLVMGCNCPEHPWTAPKLSEQYYSSFWILWNHSRHDNFPEQVRMTNYLQNTIHHFPAAPLGCKFFISSSIHITLAWLEFSFATFSTSGLPPPPSRHHHQPPDTCSQPTSIPIITLSLTPLSLRKVSSMHFSCSHYLL